MKPARSGYSRALAAFDPALIVAELSEEVTIRVAVHDQPLVGRPTASFLFGVLAEELAPFVLIDEIVEGDTSVVLFDTEVRSHPAQGLNVVRFGPDALVEDLTVFFRPLDALRLIAEVIGARMAERFGPPPQGLS
jgi:hypothetical protein